MVRAMRAGDAVARHSRAGALGGKDARQSPSCASLRAHHADRLVNIYPAQAGHRADRQRKLYLDACDGGARCCCAAAARAYPGLVLARRLPLARLIHGSAIESNCACSSCGAAACDAVCRLDGGAASVQRRMPLAQASTAGMLNPRMPTKRPAGPPDAAGATPARHSAPHASPHARAPVPRAPLPP